MKIAVYYNLPSGGAKRALYEQVNRLRKNHQVDIYTLNTANHTFCDLRKFVRNYFIYDFPQRKPFPLNLFDIYQKLPQIEQKIANLINLKEYDVVLVCHDYFTQAPFLLRYLTIPSVYYCQEPKREFYEKIPRVRKSLTYHLTLPFRKKLKSIDLENIRYAKKVLVNSKYSEKIVEKIYSVKAYVNYLGVNTEVFLRKPWVKRENIILSVGGFNLLKGHDFVINSISLIPEEKRPKLVIVGNGGEDKEYLKSLAKNKKVKLRIRENIGDEELVKWYNTAKVLAYAPQREPFGLVTLEAIACGLPVVSVDDSGVSEVLKDIHSAMLVKRDIERMSKALAFVLSQERNHNTIEKDIAYISHKYNWDNSVEELEDYLEFTSLLKQ